jgi:solute:Na+ symporter, SSS family
LRTIRKRLADGGSIPWIGYTSTTADRKRFGPQTEVWTGRAVVVDVTVVAYLIALQLKDKASIFELAIRFASLGFAAMAPVMIAALYWRRSNKWGALAATLWGRRDKGRLMVSLWRDQGNRPPKPGQPFVQIFPALGDLFQRSPTNVLVHGYLPVGPMCLGSALWVIVVSLLTPPPNRR